MMTVTMLADDSVFAPVQATLVFVEELTDKPLQLVTLTPPIWTDAVKLGVDVPFVP